ncbi:Protein SPEAR3 [Quillaja saponaria]|uniref:Protein SPEAR3 n=1 Tax=Quillaja saponaria TaxID=32244 RepID=A0AAD7M411_QUISA|nr:Protein SPEAR3 [Quillaja saponaria]
MGSSYFGEPNMGNNERVSGSSSSSSSSSRKGKKNNSDKPKQPQRGLGVAQLEKIRLHGQVACAYQYPINYPSNFNNEDLRFQTAYSTIPASSSSRSSSASYGCFPPNVVMGLPEYERTSIKYGADHTPSTHTARWDSSNGFVEPQPFVQPSMTKHLINLHDSQHKNMKKHRSNSMGSNSQNSKSSDSQELDLELRLSL